MVGRFIVELGPWSWMLLGFVLLGLEILVPGVFLLWIGIAAILTGTLSLQVWEMAFWTWQVQVLVFLLLSLVSAYVGRRILGARGGISEEPLLNRRAEQLVGRTATLGEPITEGYGRMKIGDTLWRVRGPDLPVGARVKVIDVSGGELLVEPA